MLILIQGIAIQVTILFVFYVIVNLLPDSFLVVGALVGFFISTFVAVYTVTILTLKERKHGRE